MKLTHEELWHLVRCSEWLESGDKGNEDQDRKFRSLHRKLKNFYRKQAPFKATLEIK